MKCKIIGCTSYKLSVNDYRCSLYALIEDNASTHIFLISKELFKKITQIKKLPSDFASRCNTCTNYNCNILLNSDKISIYDIFCSIEQTNSEKRNSKRLLLEFPCKIKFANKIYSAKISNISVCGAMLEVESEFDSIVDKDLEIYPNDLKTGFDDFDTYTHENRDKNKTIHGKVVWSVDNRIGIKFFKSIEINHIFQNFLPKYTHQYF